jgi:hypothetical protein
LENQEDYQTYLNELTPPAPLPPTTAVVSSVVPAFQGLNLAVLVKKMRDAWAAIAAIFFKNDPGSAAFKPVTESAKKVDWYVPAYAFRQNDFTLGWEFAKQRQVLANQIQTAEGRISKLQASVAKSTALWILGSKSRDADDSKDFEGLKYYESGFLFKLLKHFDELRTSFESKVSTLQTSIKSIQERDAKQDAQLAENSGADEGCRQRVAVLEQKLAENSGEDEDCRARVGVLERKLARNSGADEDFKRSTQENISILLAADSKITQTIEVTVRQQLDIFEQRLKDDQANDAGAERKVRGLITDNEALRTRVNELERLVAGLLRRGPASVTMRSQPPVTSRSQPPQPRNLAQDLKKLFAKADVSDGTWTFGSARPDQMLDRTELAHRLNVNQLIALLEEAGVLHKLNGKHNIESIVQQMDTNRDGKVSIEEFLQFAAIPAAKTMSKSTSGSYGFSTTSHSQQAVQGTVSRRRTSFSGAEFGGFAAVDNQQASDFGSNDAASEGSSWGFNASGGGARSRAAPPGKMGGHTVWQPRNATGAKAAPVVARRGSAALAAGSTSVQARDIETRLLKVYERAEKTNGRKTGAYVDPVRAFTPQQMDFRVGYIDVQTAIGRLKSFNKDARGAYPFSTPVADHWRTHSSVCGRDGKMTVGEWLTHVDPLETVAAAIQGSFDV